MILAQGGPQARVIYASLAHLIDGDEQFRQAVRRADARGSVECGVPLGIELAEPLAPAPGEEDQDRCPVIVPAECPGDLQC
jgi:hypothetical protein